MSEILKCFGKYSVSFKEKRFVFDPPPMPTKVEGEKPDEPVAPVEAPKLPYFYDPKTKAFTDPEKGQTITMEPAEAEKREAELILKGYSKNPEAAKLAGKATAERDALKDRSEVSLDTLRGQMKPNQFEQLATQLNLKGEIFKDQIAGDFDFGKPENLSSLSEKISVVISEKMKDAAVLENIHKILITLPGLSEMTKPEAQSFVANLYASKVVGQIKSEFEKGSYAEFLKNYPANYQLGYAVNVQGYSAFEAKFSFADPVQQKAYDEFKAKKGASAVDPITGKPVEPDKYTAAAPEQLKHDANVQAFKKSWVAKIMGILGLLPMKKETIGGKDVDVPDFDAVLAGGDPIAVAVIGVCGGKNLLDNPAAYDEMKANLPAAQIAQLNGLEKRCETSLAYLGKVKPGEGKEGAIAPFDQPKFEKWVNGTEKMPDTGFTLNTSVKVANLKFKDLKLKNLKLDLSGGGDVTLAPRNFFKIEVDGKEEEFPKPADEKAKTLKGNDLRGMKIVAIPSGTVFKGNVKPIPGDTVEVVSK